jgi:hypothetical protein
MVTVDLIGQASSGSVYQLRNGTIHVTGPGYIRAWDTESDPGRTSLTDQVAPGNYFAVLDGGWHLERVLGASNVALPAQLTSPNPVAFTVVSGQLITVTLRFRVDGEDVALTGRYSISVQVDEPVLRGEVVIPSIDASGAASSSVSVFSADATADANAFRRISGASTTLTTPEAAVVAGDQLIVCDSTRQAIVFFPRTASGNIVPTKQIIGSSTQLNGPVDIAVSSGEVYVLHRTGILVFPLGAIGNTSPSRTLTLPDRGGRHLAIDNGQIYVSVQSGTEADVRVYGASSMSLSRQIFSATAGFCPSGLALNGSEMFVTDVCGAAIDVFPEVGSGVLVPTRVIRGPNTELGAPPAVALFQNELYMLDADQTIRVFPVAGSGDILPARALGGPHTGITSAHGIFLR